MEIDSVNVDWVQNPLQIISSLYGEHPSDHVTKVRDHFASRLKEENSLTQVPSLNNVPLHDLCTNSLVRMRCMVQDMYDPEYYLGTYEVLDKTTKQQRLQSGHFRDFAECKPHEEILMSSAKNETKDRQSLYCVPIPGENTWVKSSYSEGCSQPQPRSTSSAGRQKRPLDDDTDTTPQPSAVEKSEASMEVAMEDTGAAGSDNQATKKSKTETKPGSSQSTAPSLNFPLPEEKGPACLAKVYDTNMSFKVNEVVEFIGVLSNDPALAKFKDESEKSAFMTPGDDMMEGVEDDQNLPPSLVPRLHVIIANRLPHNNPHIPRNIHGNQEVAALVSQFGEIREQLLMVLTRAMLGDRLAAEYLLCNITSTVHARHDVIALGKLAVNISGCPADMGFTTMLYDLIKQLLTKSHFLPLKVDTLNQSALTPQKDYKLNRLSSGMLQLSDGTYLVLDETAMQPGQLDTKGVQNLTALGNLIRWQKVEYDFSYHKQDFHTNIPVLVLSEGKSMIQCDVQIPLAHKETESDFEALKTQMTPELLTRWRTYLSLVRLLPYDLQDDIQKQVESDFVDLRKEDPKSMSVDDFHVLLTIARLLTLSHGLPGLTIEMWNKAKSLESQRKQRLGPTTATCA